MSTELKAPFGLTPSGGIAAVSVPGTQVQQHLQALVSTNPGERVMKPTYGIPLSSYVFGLDADAVASAIANDIAKAVRTWEPSVSLQNVRSVVSDTSEGIAAINVTYTPGPTGSSPTTLSTATVLPGGTVVGSSQ